MFKGNVTIRKENETHYRLVGYLAYKNDEIEVTVKGGFLTDGASIPRFLWRLYGSPFLGKYTASAIIHDALYGSHLTTKEVADDLFLEMMEAEGVSYWKRKTMYWAVKYFGGSSWDKPSEVINRNEQLVEVEYANCVS